MACLKLSGGHTGSVLALEIQTNSQQLVSGSENGELCLWSDNGQVAEKMVRAGVECTSVIFSKDKPNIVYAAFGEEVLMIDTLRFKEPVFTFKSNQDDINQIALDSKEEFLAACDDGAEVKVYGLKDRKVFKSLRFGHTNICSTVMFRPNRKWEIISGGLDCRLVQWDFSKPKCMHQVNMQQIQSTTADESYLVNPPFIHHISASPDNGNLFAAGLENGRIPILDGRGKNLQASYALHAHRLGVSQVQFLSEDSLVSSGNDCCISEWDLSKAEGVTFGGGGDIASSDGASSEEQRCAAVTERCKVHTYQHTSKVNWLAVGRGSEECRHKLYVADQSSDITVLNVT